MFLLCVSMRCALGCALAEEQPAPSDVFGTEFDRIFALRKREKQVFYDAVIPRTLSKGASRVVLD